MGERPDEVGAAGARDYARRRPVSGEYAASEGRPVDSGDVEAAQLRSDIEHTRSEMSDTLNALQERLAPERLISQVKEQVKEQATEALDSAKQAVRDATVGKAEKMLENVGDTVNDVTRKAGQMMGGTGSSIMDQMRQNPLAYGLIGVGLGMLLAHGKGKGDRSPRQTNSPGSGDYVRLSGSADASPNQPLMTERVREAASGVADLVQDKVSSLAATARGTTSTVVDRTREQFDHLGGQAKQQAQRASSSFDTLLHDNPLAAGAIALVAGAALGLVLPSTKLESEYMGEARAQLGDRAQEIAKDTLEKVQRVAGEAGRALKEEAQHEGLPVGS